MNTRYTLRKFLCAAARIVSLEIQTFAQASRRIFKVRNYGARNDGPASSIEGFARAIAVMRSAGGGTVCVPAGRYTAGPIELYSNITLHVDAGATITFPCCTVVLCESRYIGVEALAPHAVGWRYDLD